MKVWSASFAVVPNVNVPGPLCCVHVPVPIAANASTVCVNPHSSKLVAAPGSYASAVGCTSLVNTTSSKLSTHVPLLIVQRKVLLLPAVKPVIVVLALFGLVIVTAKPDCTLHVPVPTVGTFAAITKVLLSH